jgi:hypothetical protein
VALSALCRLFAAFFCPDPLPSSYPFRSGFRFRFPELDGVELTELSDIDDVVACNGINGGNESVDNVVCSDSLRSTDTASLSLLRRDRRDLLDRLVLFVDSLAFDGFMDSLDFDDLLDFEDSLDFADSLDLVESLDFTDLPLRRLDTADTVEVVDVDAFEAVEWTEHALSASEGVRERANASSGGGDKNGDFADEPEAVRRCSLSLRFRFAFFLRFDFLRTGSGLGGEHSTGS